MAVVSWEAVAIGKQRAELFGFVVEIEHSIVREASVDFWDLKQKEWSLEQEGGYSY